jgi:hypothetical protein
MGMTLAYGDTDRVLPSGLGPRSPKTVPSHGINGTYADLPPGDMHTQCPSRDWCAVIPYPVARRTLPSGTAFVPHRDAVFVIARNAILL